MQPFIAWPAAVGAPPLGRLDDGSIGRARGFVAREGGQLAIGTVVNPIVAGRVISTEVGSSACTKHGPPRCGMLGGRGSRIQHGDPGNSRDRDGYHAGDRSIRFNFRHHSRLLFVKEERDALRWSGA
jgi:hypothetical protein